ncbi:hypothetical protein Zm00014a_032188 [Zea mays]|uniref:PB1 domain-containing protein n=1 Tax=Zea mays TaxID=4577 RepID=A0A3L6F0Y1_MAIZE|nr:hypothetical protein Zm00014a_032188 [Zea mays]
MAGTSSWSSSSSCASSFGSPDHDVVCVTEPDSVDAAGAVADAEGSVKFLCSYGGRILPRRTDGTLRYVGGDNRVLSVDRPIRFYVLQRKLRELCGGWEAHLRCQLPTEDLDALISVTCDDDLAKLLEEYDEASKDRLQSLKIRAFLFPTRTPAPSILQRRSPPSIAHLHWQNTSPPPAAAGVSLTCAPRWWAAPQASRQAQAPQAQNYDRHSLGEERPRLYYSYMPRT